MDVAIGRLLGEFEQARAKFPQHPFPLQRLVAGMQRRELDGDAGCFDRGGFRIGFGHRPDGVAVRLGVPGGIFVGAGALAEHVERGQAGAVRALPRQGFFDGSSLHEFTAHDAHRPRHGGPGNRLAYPSGQAVDPAAHVAGQVVRQADDVAGEHQGPGGGVQEYGVGLPDVLRPVCRADLLGDQSLGGIVIRNAQQRLADAQERNALLVGQAVFLQEQIQKRSFVRAPSAAFHQTTGTFQHPLAFRIGERRLCESGAHRLLFGLRTGGDDRTPPIGHRIAPCRPAALLPAVRPNTAPEVSPVPPG